MNLWELARLAEFNEVAIHLRPAAEEAVYLPGPGDVVVDSLPANRGNVSGTARDGGRNPIYARRTRRTRRR